MDKYISALPGYLAALAIAFSLSACESDRLKAASDEASDELKAFLELPQQPEKTGAHRQNDPHAELDAEKLAQVALQHLDESRGQLALDTLNAAVQKYPDNVMLLSLRASLLLQKQKTSLAMTDLNRAIELNPHDPILLTNRAQALRRFDRSQEAMRDLDSAIELDSKFIAAIFNRGSIYFEAEQYDLALADFNRCIEIAPEVAAAYFNRASTFDAIGDRQRAISDLQTFLSLSPEESWVQIAQDLLKQWQTGTS